MNIARTLLNALDPSLLRYATDTGGFVHKNWTAEDKVAWAGAILADPTKISYADVFVRMMLETKSEKV